MYGASWRVQSTYRCRMHAELGTNRLAFVNRQSRRWDAFTVPTTLAAAHKLLQNSMTLAVSLRMYLLKGKQAPLHVLSTRVCAGRIGVSHRGIGHHKLWRRRSATMHTHTEGVVK